MGDGHTAASLADGIVAVVVIRIGHEHVPLTVDHVRVQIVRAGRVIGVVPRINPGWVGLVRDINEGDRDLGGIVPFANVGVGIAGVDKLVLLNDVFSPESFQIFHVQDLGVRVVVDAGYGGVGRVGDVHDVHVVPPGEVSVRFAIWRGCHLNFSVACRGEWVEIQQFHVVRAKHVLACIRMVVIFSLNQRVIGLKGWLFLNGGLDVVTKDENQG